MVNKDVYLIVRSGKSDAELTITSMSLSKLTTDRHKASRGLSATAELPYLIELR